MHDIDDYLNDRSSAEAVAVGAALRAVRSGECADERVASALDELAAVLPQGDEITTAAHESSVHYAWSRFSKEQNQ